MTEEQKQTVKRIKEELKRKIQQHNNRHKRQVLQKVIKEFEVGDLGGAENLKKYRLVCFETNFEEGNARTALNGILTIGPRGGVQGTVYTWTNKTRVNSKNELYKISMWV